MLINIILFQNNKLIINIIFVDNSRKTINLVTNQNKNKIIPKSSIESSIIGIINLLQMYTNNSVEMNIMQAQTPRLRNNLLINSFK